jgi:acyl carrier protein
MANPFSNAGFRMFRTGYRVRYRSSHCLEYLGSNFHPPATETSEVTPWVEPRTQLEIAMAKIWCDVLGIDSLSVNDNFFDLGGHSLLAVRIIAQLKGHMGVIVGLWDLFSMPTVAGLSAHLHSMSHAKLAVEGHSDSRTGIV